jgi:hypothetical protein
MELRGQMIRGRAGLESLICCAQAQWADLVDAPRQGTGRPRGGRLQQEHVLFEQVQEVRQFLFLRGKLQVQHRWTNDRATVRLISLVSFSAPSLEARLTMQLIRRKFTKDGSVHVSASARPD